MERPKAFGEIHTWREIEEATLEIFGDPRLASAWLHKPMIRYAGSSPAQAWETGQQQLVINMVRQAAAGFVF
ncbi:hypothetical protein ACT5AY_001479 [Pseudomonas aeruginosa]|uniref:hypothetical protein n=1 Tax=Pseudomonas aeruginosa group TaxID=136841 RepID=UPI00071B6DCC|nr:hypothetical protein [Pseudomonas paraeruginosa]KSP90998.1 hypothetical protein APB27_12575 [Pseudomonas aeruginosa]MBG5165528.1 hypothetical protein [Pseudomonas aeruginosa]MBH3771487.1 hypothetical protein [Pseudomonas aeruginosa]RTT26691.1 hypothetical protein DY956_30225 [Pseudomonas paraeruginosa]HEK1481314.1 hypothetical protein [Pseudomonas aeruginosa]